ncbi:MAG: SpoIIE family protein phosphatase [Pseudomarimonas sp.]
MSVRFGRSLRGRFLWLVVAVFVGVGAVAAFGFFRVADRIIESLGAGYATQYASQSRGKILARVQRELVLAQKLVDSPLLRRWAVAESDPELTALSLAELESYRKLFADHSYFFVIDASQNYYFNDADNQFAGKELRYRMDSADPTMAWYFDTMREVETFALHVDNNPQLGVTKLWINAIVRGEDGKKVGLGGSGLDLSVFLQEIVRTTDAGVETWLVDGEGFLQGHPDRALMQANAEIRDESARKSVFELLDIEAERDELRALLADMAKADTSADARLSLTIGGHQRLAAISYLPEIHWATIVVVDPFEVVRLETFIPILILLGAALLATILLVSWLLNRLVLARLARLTDHTGEVAKGRYDVQLSVDRDDEIGQLTTSFNHMTATIGDHTQNLESKVASRTHDLQLSNDLLEASNKKVMDSIEYARLIQASLLASPAEMARLFADSTVLWLPRDVVGGDFYTLYADGEDGFLLAVGDCTGHGVPGAFMTMAAKALLDRAVATLGMQDPAALLDEVNRGLHALLHSGDYASSSNGLDLGLLHVANGRHSATFAGAKQSLWMLRPDAEIEIIKGDRRSIGYRRSAAGTHFANHVLTLTPGLRLYLFTDGLLDQNGGERAIALGTKALSALLQSWREQALAAQGDLLRQALIQYRGALPQRDDIALVGIRLDNPAHFLSQPPARSDS